MWSGYQNGVVRCQSKRAFYTESDNCGAKLFGIFTGGKYLDCVNAFQEFEKLLPLKAILVQCWFLDILVVIEMSLQVSVPRMVRYQRSI